MGKSKDPAKEARRRNYLFWKSTMDAWFPVPQFTIEEQDEALLGMLRISSHDDHPYKRHAIVVRPGKIGWEPYLVDYEGLEVEKHVPQQQAASQPTVQTQQQRLQDWSILLEYWTGVVQRKVLRAKQLRLDEIEEGE